MTENNTKLTFKRYETKYLLTAEQYDALWQRLRDRVQPDEYCRSTVCSIYYDSSDFDLIRRSVDGPVYKEKLRLRSYGIPDRDSTVFVELKKKYKGIVYKRRITMTEQEAERYLSGQAPAPEQSQVSREIDWFLRQHQPEARVLIACDREAYVALEDNELRFTFDKHIRWREDDLSLCSGDAGEELLENDMVLMEIKLPEAAPVWLAELLSELEIFPQGFSKYGTCYKNKLIGKYFDGVIEIA